MDGILYWLAIAGAGLFFVAVVVAWWEHLGRTQAEQAFVNAPPARAASVDLDLDQLPHADSAERKEVLDGALERMTQPGALATGKPRGWVETTPMVLAPTQRPAAQKPTSRA